MPGPIQKQRSLLSEQWFQSMYGSITKVIGGIWSRYGGQGWTRFKYILPGSRFDYEREAGHTWLNPIVGLAIDWMGNRFPRPPLRICKINSAGENVPLPRHEMIDLWKRPNPFYSRRTMEKAIGLSLKCDGNAYIYKVRDGAGNVVQLWWIPHYRILPTWPPDGSAYIDGYRVWLDSTIYWLPVEDVIHIRDGIDPLNERLGICALRSNLREVCTVNEESGFRAAILRNSGVPSLAIVPKNTGAKPSKEEADDLRQEFVEVHGTDNRGRIAVLAGEYELVKVGYSPEQLNLVQLPVIPTARILSSLGVAAMSLGLPDPDKTYSNLEAANRMSWGSIISIQELIAESLQFELLSEFGDDPLKYVVEYDYAEIQELQESLDAIHTRAQNDFKAGLITRNEGRERIGEPQIEKGDTFFPGTGGVAEDPTKVALSQRETTTSDSSDLQEALSEDNTDQARLESAEKKLHRGIEFRGMNGHANNRFSLPPLPSNNRDGSNDDELYLETANQIVNAIEAKFSSSTKFSISPNGEAKSGAAEAVVSNSTSTEHDSIGDNVVDEVSILTLGVHQELADWLSAKTEDSAEVESNANQQADTKADSDQPIQPTLPFMSQPAEGEGSGS